MSLHMQRLLGQAIVKGDYENKPFPSEADLTLTYGVSRTVVREAIRMLVAKGLVSVRQRHTTRATSMSAWNLLDPEVSLWLMERPYSKQICLAFIEMRLGIEPVAAALAAEFGSQADIDAIGHEVARMTMFRDAPHSLLIADIAFHIAILRASGNPFFLRLEAFITTALRMSIQASQHVDGIDISMHDALYQMIAMRKADDAEAEARRLLKNAMTLVRKYEPPQNDG